MKEEETIGLTPKGIASLAMLQSGLITDFEDPRFEGFWQLFVTKMIKCGYAEDMEDENAGN